jgi:hypothetical protein
MYVCEDSIVEDLTHSPEDLTNSPKGLAPEDLTHSIAEDLTPGATTVASALTAPSIHKSAAASPAAVPVVEEEGNTSE